jgi:hypothetical protein
MEHVKLTSLIVESDQGVEVLSEEDSKKVDSLLIGIIKRVLMGMKKDDPEAFEKLVPVLKDEKKMVDLLKNPEIKTQGFQIQNQISSQKEKTTEAEETVAVNPNPEDPIDKMARIAKKGRDVLTSPNAKAVGSALGGAAKFGLKATGKTLLGMVKLANWLRKETGDIKFAVGLGIFVLLLGILGPKKMAYGLGVGLEYTGKSLKAATSETPPPPKPGEKKQDDKKQGDGKKPWYYDLVWKAAGMGG